MVVAREVNHIFERAVDAGAVPGVVALAADKRGIIYEGAFGRREIGKDSAMSLVLQRQFP